MQEKSRSLLGLGNLSAQPSEMESDKDGKWLDWRTSVLEKKLLYDRWLQSELCAFKSFAMLTRARLELECHLHGHYVVQKFRFFHVQLEMVSLEPWWMEKSIPSVRLSAPPKTRRLQILSTWYSGDICINADWFMASINHASWSEGKK